MSTRVKAITFRARPCWLWGVYRRMRDGAWELWPRSVRCTRSEAIDAYCKHYTIDGRPDYERERRRGDVAALQIFATPDFPVGA